MTYESDTNYVLNSEIIKRFRESLSTLLTDEKFQFMYSRIENNTINANDILKDMVDILKISLRVCLQQKKFI